MNYEKEFGFRYMLAGKCDDKYGIKDLEDDVTEFFTEDEALELGKLFKIAGITGDCIDLHWFRTFYSRLILAYGVEKAMALTNIKLDSKGNFHRCYTRKDESVYCKFLEFISDFNNDSGIPLTFGLNDFVSVLEGSGFMYAFNTSRVYISLSYNVMDILASRFLYRHCKPPLRILCLGISLDRIEVTRDFCRYANIETEISIISTKKLVLKEPIKASNIAIECPRVALFELVIYDINVLDSVDLRIYNLPKFLVRSVKVLIEVVLKLGIHSSFWNSGEIQYRLFDSKDNGVRKNLYHVIDIYDMNNGDVTLEIDNNHFWVLNFNPSYKIKAPSSFKTYEIPTNFEENHGITYEQFMSVVRWG